MVPAMDMVPVPEVIDEPLIALTITGSTSNRLAITKFAGPKSETEVTIKLDMPKLASYRQLPKTKRCSIPTAVSFSTAEPVRLVLGK
jgi:hypothetical protein